MDVDKKTDDERRSLTPASSSPDRDLPFEQPVMFDARSGRLLVRARMYISKCRDWQGSRVKARVGRDRGFEPITLSVNRSTLLLSCQSFFCSFCSIASPWDECRATNEPIAIRGPPRPL